MRQVIFGSGTVYLRVPKPLILPSIQPCKTGWVQRLCHLGHNCAVWVGQWGNDWTINSGNNDNSEPQVVVGHTQKSCLEETIVLLSLCKGNSRQITQTLKGWISWLTLGYILYSSFEGWGQHVHAIPTQPLSWYLKSHYSSVPTLMLDTWGPHNT